MPTTTGYAVSPIWKGILADYGVDYVDVLRASGLPDDLFERPDPRVKGDDFFRLCDAIETAVDDPRFALLSVENTDLAWFSPAVFAALCSPNLATAVKRLSRFKPLIAPIDLEVTDAPDGLTVRYRFQDQTVSPPRFFTSYEPLFLVKLARTGTRQRVVPTAVTMPSAPPAADEYAAYLGASPTLGDTVSVTFAPEDAVRPFLTADPGMWGAFEPELRRRLHELEGSAAFSERTRAVLLEALPSGQASIHSVAKRLGVSSRTLQRRLHSEDTTFNDLVASTRERLARHYLTSTTHTSTEIAYLLGFEEPSSFFRAFHDWTGTTPETVRRAHA